MVSELLRFSWNVLVFGWVQLARGIAAFILNLGPIDSQRSPHTP